MRRPFSYKLNIFLFLLPALVLFIGVLIAPIIMSGYYSLTEWNGLTTPQFIGLAWAGDITPEEYAAGLDSDLH